MFGDFFNNFGFTGLLQQMQEAQQQPPFMPGQVDAQGGMFAPTAGAPGTPTVPGMGGGPGRAAGAPPGGGAPPSGGPAAPAPTASSVAQPPALSALAPGGGSPLGPPQPGQPGQPGLGPLPKGPLEQGADEALGRYRSNQVVQPQGARSA